MDEPLGALDLKLRQEMQIELKAIQQQVGITFVYVTHDQEEALTMSDRMAVFNLGRIEQVGTPAEVYESPGTVFVAGFVGTSNILAETVAMAATGFPNAFTVRPEKIRLAPVDAPVDLGMCTLEGTVNEVVYLGMYTRYAVTLPQGVDIVVVQQNLNATAATSHVTTGQKVRMMWERVHNHPIKLGTGG